MGRARDHDVYVFVIESLFTTLTNVNFDPSRFETLIAQAAAMRDRAGVCYETACAKAESRSWTRSSRPVAPPWRCGRS